MIWGGQIKEMIDSIHTRMHSIACMDGWTEGKRKRVSDEEMDGWNGLETGCYKV